MDIKCDHIRIIRIRTGNHSNVETNTAPVNPKKNRMNNLVSHVTQSIREILRNFSLVASSFSQVAKNEHDHEITSAPVPGFTQLLTLPIDLASDLPSSTSTATSAFLGASTYNYSIRLAFLHSCASLAMTSALSSPRQRRPSIVLPFLTPSSPEAT